MENMSIKTDLITLNAAFVTNLKGKTMTKQCLVIPIEDADLFLGKNGVYLNLTAIEMREPKYSDTHCVKQSIDRDKYDAMTDDQRKSIPILGGMRAIESTTTPMKVTTVTDSATAIDDDDDLPF